MKTILTLVCLTASCFLQSQATKPFVCFWDSCNPDSIDSIPIHLCTHVVYAHLGVNLETWEVQSTRLESCKVGSDYLSKLVALKSKKPSLKVSFAIGGRPGSLYFPDVVSNISRIDAFVTSVVNLTDTYGFDGVDLAWTTSAVESPKLLLLVVALRAALGESKLLTMSTHPLSNFGKSIPCLASHLDYLHLETFGLRTFSGNTIGNHVSLYASSRDQHLYPNRPSVAHYMNYWASEGVPKNKLLMGFAFYGEAFHLSDPNLHEPGDPSRHDWHLRKSRSFWEFCLEKHWKHVFDYETKTPYAFRDELWVGYEDVESIQHKTEFINQEGYGGAATWSLQNDDSHNLCDKGSYPLASAVVRGLKSE